MPNVRETTKLETNKSVMNYYFAIYKNECLWKNKRWVKGYCTGILGSKIVKSMTINIQEKFEDTKE